MICAAIRLSYMNLKREGDGKMIDGRVSIITPCYNSERFIAQTIESVLGQTYADWEQIVVDDGSINMHIHDEANIMRARTEEARQSRLDSQAELRQQKYEEARGRWKVAVVIWLAVSVAMLACQGLVKSAVPDFAQTYLVLNGGVLLFGPIGLFLLRPKRPR